MPSALASPNGLSSVSAAALVSSEMVAVIAAVSLAVIETPLPASVELPSM
jgi:hypothetical protein